MFVEHKRLASPASALWLVPAESSRPQRPQQAMFLCVSVNESRLGWSVSEWRGREFSRENCTGQRVVSIIQGKHWAAWLHALDVTKDGRTEMDETMRLLLACMPAWLRLPPALPILSSCFYPCSVIPLGVWLETLNTELTSGWHCWCLLFKVMPDTNLVLKISFCLQFAVGPAEWCLINYF